MLSKIIKSLFLTSLFAMSTCPTLPVLANEPMTKVQGIIGNYQSDFKNLSVQEFNNKYKNEIEESLNSGTIDDWNDIYSRSILYSSLEFVYGLNNELPVLSTSAVGFTQVGDDNYTGISVLYEYSWDIADKSKMTVEERFNLLNSLENGVTDILCSKTPEDYSDINISDIVSDEISALSRNLSNDKIIITTNILSCEVTQ